MRISYALRRWWVSWIYYRRRNWRDFIGTCIERVSKREGERESEGEGEWLHATNIVCLVNAFNSDYSMSKLNVPKLQLLPAAIHEIECCPPRRRLYNKGYTKKRGWIIDRRSGSGIITLHSAKIIFGSVALNLIEDIYFPIPTLFKYINMHLM